MDALIIALIVLMGAHAVEEALPAIKEDWHFESYDRSHYIGRTLEYLFLMSILLLALVRNWQVA